MKNMLIKEFGNKSNKTIILLHGGGLSWWMYEEIIEFLKSDYHVIVPIIDGHGEAFDTIFTSIENFADKLIDYIKINFNGKVFSICGFSLGAQITTNILMKEKDICDYAIVESALIKPIKFMSFYKIMVKFSYPLINKKWFQKRQAKELFISDDNFDLYFKDISKMKYETLKNLVVSNGTFKIDEKKIETNAKVLIIVGENELKDMVKSGKELNKIIEKSSLKIISNYSHGELSIKNPKEYCDIFNEFLKCDIIK